MLKHSPQHDKCPSAVLLGQQIDPSALFQPPAFLDGVFDGFDLDHGVTELGVDLGSKTIQIRQSLLISTLTDQPPG
jgi:hypothetical protein